MALKFLSPGPRNDVTDHLDAYTLLILWYPGTSLLRPDVVARLDTKL